MTLKIHFPKPHPRQRQFLDAPERRVMVVAGRRGGKTTGMAILAVRAFLQRQKVLYAAPVIDQTRIFWDAVRDILRELIDAKLIVATHSHRLLHWRTNREGEIRAVTAHNHDNMRGDFIDLAILDEYQLFSEDAWDSVVAPMLIDRSGKAVFIMTPPSVASNSASKAKDKRHSVKMYNARTNDPSWSCLTFPSYENPHLPDGFIEQARSDMSEARFKAEIEADISDSNPNALWRRENIAIRAPESLRQVVVAVDPSASKGGDPVGICIVGRDADRIGYILDDRSIADATPREWADEVARAVRDHKANSVVVEGNQGGDMAVEVLRGSLPRGIPIVKEHAVLSKVARAEPVAALYQSGRVFHAKQFSELEEEMLWWTPDTTTSPNRMDAMVWGVTHLLAIGVPQNTPIGRSI